MVFMPDKKRVPQWVNGFNPSAHCVKFGVSRRFDCDNSLRNQFLFGTVLNIKNGMELLLFCYSITDWFQVELSNQRKPIGANSMLKRIQYFKRPKLMRVLHLVSLTVVTCTLLETQSDLYAKNIIKIGTNNKLLILWRI